MSDAPRERPKLDGIGNMGQGNPVDRLTRPLAENPPPGPLGAVMQKVALASLARGDEIPWHDWFDVLPIAFKPDRCFVSRKNSAVVRIGEMWCRVKGLGVRWQYSVWINRAEGRPWMLEQQTAGGFSCIHFDAQEHRGGLAAWLMAVWQWAYVDGGGNLPYRKGHASPASLYFSVGSDGHLLPSADERSGELVYPWSGWERTGDADARRRFGAVPQRMGEPHPAGDGEAAAGGQDGGRGEAGRDVSGGGDGQPRGDHGVGETGPP